MSTCSVAVGLLSTVIVVHSSITVILTALVIWIRCFCNRHRHYCHYWKKRSSSYIPDTTTTLQDLPKPTAPPPPASAAAEPAPSPDHGEHGTREVFPRRHGQFEAPNITTESQVTVTADMENRKLSLPTSLPLASDRSNAEIYSNQSFEPWEQRRDEVEFRPSRTIEEIRRNSTSSIRKPLSPFRRISSPLTVFTSKFGRKSVEVPPEAMNLMATLARSPTDEQSRSIDANPGGTGSSNTKEESQSMEKSDVPTYSTIGEVSSSKELLSRKEDKDQEDGYAVELPEEPLTESQSPPMTQEDADTTTIAGYVQINTAAVTTAGTEEGEESRHRHHPPHQTLDSGGDAPLDPQRWSSEGPPTIVILSTEAENESNC